MDTYECSVMSRSANLVDPPHGEDQEALRLRGNGRGDHSNTSLVLYIFRWFLKTVKDSVERVRRSCGQNRWSRPEI